MQETTTRKPTNLTLDQSLLTAARDLKINLSRAAEDGIRQAVAQSRELQWKAENRAALDSSNTFVEENGTPLARHRQF